jgi:hypothetical protein
VHVFEHAPKRRVDDCGGVQSAPQRQLPVDPDAHRFQAFKHAQRTGCLVIEEQL